MPSREDDARLLALCAEIDTLLPEGALAWR
jgi:hypothetical protein